ncbi:MAG: ABC transporter permease [Peptococcaceae bacterium]|nr:ABC transporter permease [Peptococcaceae bacterium]
MNVLSKFTVQALKRNRARTLVTIIGVILSVAMLTGATTAIFSFQNYLREAAENAIAQNGNWHIKFLGIDAAFAQGLDADDAVERTALIQNSGCARLEGGQNQNRPYLFVAGFNDQAFKTLPVILLSGRMPQNSSEIVISEQIQTDGGVKYSLGDTVTLEMGYRIRNGQKLGPNDAYPYLTEVQENLSEVHEEMFPNISSEDFQAQTPRTYVVVGVCANPIFLYSRAPGYAVITQMDTANASNTCDVYVTLHSPTPDQVLDFGIQHSFSPAPAAPATAETSDGFAAQGSSGWEVSNTLYSGASWRLYIVGGILIALIMAGSVLLIYNSFSLSVSERVRQFGILASVGATRKQLRHSVMLEGVGIGIIGIPLGILAGAGGVAVLQHLWRFLAELLNWGDLLEVPALSVSAIAVTATALLGMATILISAYIPARKAAKLSAIDSIRQTKDIKAEAKAIKTSKLTERFFGWEGVLARKSFKRNKKRYRVTIISLFVSVVLFISVNAFGLYLNPTPASPDSTEGYNIEVQDTWEWQEQSRKAGLVINIFIYGFIGLLTLIAVATVFNTISTAIILRRREFAMLRSAGMSGKSFYRMLAYECLSYGVRALILGIPVSIGASCLIYERIRNASMDVPFMLPWGSMGISVLSVFILVFITMLYAIRKVNTENTVDVLKNDML